MSKSLLHLLILSFLIGLINCSDINTKHDCLCSLESDNGYYCKQWVCEVNNDCFHGDSIVNVITDNKVIPTLVKNLKKGQCVQDNFDEKYHCSQVTIISHRET